jgi:hypothetical protein
VKPRGVVVAIGAAIALLLAVLLVYTSWAGDGHDETARAFGVEAARDPADIEIERVPAELADVARLAADTQREAAAPAEATAPTATSTSTSTVRRRVRVLDLDGQPVVGVSVAPMRNPVFTVGTTAEDGTFALARGEDGSALEVVDGRWYTLRDTEPLERPDGIEVLLLVAPKILVSGRVEDASGAPVPGATVKVELPATVFATFPEPLDRAREARSVPQTTAADGSFDLSIPSAPHAAIFAERDGYSRTTIPAPLVDRSGLVLTLAAPAATSSLRVAGVVLHADGTPGVGATVRYGEAAAGVDAQGRFEIQVGQGFVKDQPLVAVKRGFQAASVPDFWATVQVSSGTLPFQRLVLGPPPLAIEGRVVDEDGRPQSGWTVQPIDPLLLLEGMIPPESAESVAQGTAIRAETDDEGRFRLEGLLDRMYRLQAHSREALIRIESAPIQAGARNVQFVVPPDALFAKVEGIVVSADGSPIAGVDVRVALIVFRTQSGYTMEHAPEVKTDAEGRFVLMRVPRRFSKLDATSDAILPAALDLTDHVDGEPVRIVAARRCHARVEGVPEASKLTWIRVLDASGESLQMMRFRSGGWMSSGSVSLADGATAVFAVSETARTLVFGGADVPEVSRALTLAPGEITVVRW